jgi:hypothetical protein
VGSDGRCAVVDARGSGAKRYSALSCLSLWHACRFCVHVTGAVYLLRELSAVFPEEAVRLLPQLAQAVRCAVAASY